MSLTALARGRSRIIAFSLAAGLALVTLGAPADAVIPAGSRAAVQLETGDATGDPAAAITSGWWGHEGGAHDGTGTGSTFLSMDASDSNGQVTPDSIAALLAAMGTDSLNNISYAIVPTSADGSNEAPTVTAGENAAEAFHWVLGERFGTGLNGNTNLNDAVTTVSTLTQITDWVKAAEPVQGYDNSLVLHDVNAPGNPVSAKPKGTSILNTWNAGTQLSLVAYVTAGKDADLDNQVPLVAVGTDGKAKTAWLPFTVVAKPGDPVRTSAGYEVVGAYAPTVSTSASYTSTGASLTATVKTKNNTTATGATGSIEFRMVTGGVPGAPISVPTVNGVATLSIPGFTSGTRVYDARYVPDAAASATYLTSADKRTTMTAPTATTTSLSVVGGSTYDTLTATVSPKVAGVVRFYDGSTLLKSVNVSTSTGKAAYKKLLSARKHTLKATFAPTSSSYKSSISATKVVYKPTISITKSPSTVKHGTYPKLTVKVVATGTTVSGTITITYDPASGSTKTISATLSHGAKTVTLPKAVAGTTKITVKYNGHSPVLAASKSYSYKVL